jgi:hypothetical protein
MSGISHGHGHRHDHGHNHGSRPRHRRCSYCRHLGHNIITCHIKQTVDLQIKQEIEIRQEKIRVLKREASANAVAKAQLQIELAKLKAVQDYAADHTGKGDAPWVKLLPTTLGCIGSAFTLLAEYYNRIPHAETLSLILLVLTPGLLLFTFGGFVRRWWPRQT